MLYRISVVHPFTCALFLLFCYASAPAKASAGHIKTTILAVLSLLMKTIINFHQQLFFFLHNRDAETVKIDHL